MKDSNQIRIMIYSRKNKTGSEFLLPFYTIQNFLKQLFGTGSELRTNLTEKLQRLKFEVKDY